MKRMGVDSVPVRDGDPVMGERLYIGSVSAELAMVVPSVD